MYTLIAFATQWGSKHGGINSFNADFLTNFGAAFHRSAQIICVVTDHTAEAAEEAEKSHVKLVALPYIPRDRSFDSSIGELSVDLLRKAGITLHSTKTIWLGHDLITGEAAIAAAKLAGGHSAVIHHMSYDDYESYAEDSESAQKKTDLQIAILQEADLVLAIGPLLRDAASDRLGGSRPIHMLVPGLPEIDAKEAPKRFVAFLSGRLTADAARIKQGLLGVAAFASAEALAHQERGPEALKRQPKLLLRGVDFDDRITEKSLNTPHDPEAELKDFAEQYAQRVINLQVLPYTDDRSRLYSELSGASVALMPSWHEGFGLVAWEAIAAGVPLIIGVNTGVYRLLEEEYPRAITSLVDTLDVRAQGQFPYFRPEDLETTAAVLRSVAIEPVNARNKASQLRNTLLEKFTWTYCCEQAVQAFDWDLQRGSVPDRTSEIVNEIAQHASMKAVPVSNDAGPLTIPRGQWRAGAGMADSHLLRAEEELLPFDNRRQPDVQALTDWATDITWPITVRLIRGEGGQGKTRLAIHLCQQFRGQGWHSGFLDSSMEINRMPSLWRELIELKQPIFIVVDYAETRQEAFLALLRAAIQNPTDNPLRMLLLARDGGEWWDNLPSTNSICESLLIGPATTGPFRLPPLYTEQQDRQQAFGDALSAFAEILNVENPGAVPELVGDQFQRPLFIQMAALLALYGERPTSIQGLTKALLNHERRYWVGLLASFKWTDPARWAEQLLALATLVGGFPTTKVAETFWRAAKGNVPTTSEFNSLFRNLAALYPGPEGLQALRPDLLGEALVAQALLRPDGDVLLDAVLSSSATQAVRRNALTIIARMSDERADVYETVVSVLSRRLENCAAEVVAVGTETTSRLPELAEMAFERLSTARKKPVAGSLQQSLTSRSVQLAQLSSSVFGHLVERTRQKLEQKPNNADRMFEYAEALDQYGTSLYYCGRYDASREASHAALKIMRKLLARDRNRYEAVYAGYLFNYGPDLSRMGKDEEALACDFEALQIRERLKKKDPNYEPLYAKSLDRYAARLRNVGRYKEALAHAEQAVELYQRLISINQSRFEADYAEVLNNYAIHLGGVGETEKALMRSREAVEIHERWRKRNPDRFEPDYTLSLIQYASVLADIGRIREALDCVNEAQVIFQRLAQKQPQRFGTDLVESREFIRFLSWLSNQEVVVGDDGSHYGTLPPFTSHDQSQIQIIATFVDACLTGDREARVGRFRFVFSNWDSLSQRQKQAVETYRFCAAAWCSKFDSLTDPGWLADWQDYLERHKGNAPYWMTEVARRLDFKFPSLNPDRSVVS